ncbi:MAG: PQQ-dependent sugar dehydrogenase [Hyphomicrobiaceae bacterium]
MHFRSAFLIGCLVVAGPVHAAQTKAPNPAKTTGAKATVIAKGLVNPWGMQFLPDGRIIITERPGAIRIIDKDGTVSKPLNGAPKVLARGQGGMLDVALTPDFATSRTLFISFSEPRGGARSGTSIARARLVGSTGGDRLEDLRVIFRQQPASGGGLHFGSRLAIAPDGKLFVTLGERGRKFMAQDAKTHFGKVVRINPDGSVPSDNPFVGQGGSQPHLWSIGHRNPQAAAIHPQTGKLWTVEHGARGGDEINIPQSGRNYGWPVITYGRDYSGAKIGVGTRRAGMEQPVYYWDPSIAPSGMAFYSSDRFPQWQGSLFVGALRARHLARLVLDGNKVVAEEVLLENVGSRIRDVRQGPDGAIYVLTDSRNGRLLRVEPAK